MYSGEYDVCDVILSVSTPGKLEIYAWPLNHVLVIYFLTREQSSTSAVCPTPIHKEDNETDCNDNQGVCLQGVSSFKMIIYSIIEYGVIEVHQYVI
jgi:hypothetical protein